MKSIIFLSSLIFLISCGPEPVPEADPSISAPLPTKPAPEMAPQTGPKPAAQAMEDNSAASPASAAEQGPLPPRTSPQTETAGPALPPAPQVKPAARPQNQALIALINNPCKGNLRFLKANCDIPIPDWLASASIRNEIVELSSEGLIWRQGVWLAGTFKGAVWKYGEFRGGTWEGGAWEGGIWLAEGSPY